jgi:hypothetical protein
MTEFSEMVRGEEDAIGNCAEVRADDYFVHIITDDYEGHAMFHVSVARELVAVLERAIKHIESTPRAGRPTEDD